MDRLDTLLARFEREYHQINSISAHRRAQQLHVLRRLDADARLETLTPGELSAFIGGEVARGVKPQTALKYLGMVRSFVGWAELAGIIDAERSVQLKSLANPRGSTVRSKPKPYKAAEIEQFRMVLAAKYPVLPEYGRGSRALMRWTHGTSRSTALRGHLWRHARRLQFEAMIALALEEGLRKVEIFNLSIAALHPDNDQVVVLTAKQAPGSEAKRGVPYTMHARTCVQEWLDFRSLLRPEHERPWLQLHYNLGIAEQAAPLSERSMEKLLLCFEGGWRWHRFRHTAATFWLRSKVPLERVRLYMGHAQLEQTLQYAQIINSDIDEAFGAAEDTFNALLGIAA